MQDRAKIILWISGGLLLIGLVILMYFIYRSTDKDTRKWVAYPYTYCGPPSTNISERKTIKNNDQQYNRDELLLLCKNRALNPYTSPTQSTCFNITNNGTQCDFMAECSSDPHTTCQASPTHLNWTNLQFIEAYETTPLPPAVACSDKAHEFCNNLSQSECQQCMEQHKPIISQFCTPQELINIQYQMCDQCTNEANELCTHLSLFDDCQACVETLHPICNSTQIDEAKLACYGNTDCKWIANTPTNGKGYIKCKTAGTDWYCAGNTPHLHCGCNNNDYNDCGGPAPGLERNPPSEGIFREVDWGVGQCGPGKGIYGGSTPGELQCGGCGPLYSPGCGNPQIFPGWTGQSGSTEKWVCTDPPSSLCVCTPPSGCRGPGSGWKRVLT